MQIQEMEENKAQNKKLSDGEIIYDWKEVSYIVLPKLINYKKNKT